MMTEQEYQRRRRELELLIDDATDRIALADVRLVALREERLRLIVCHAQGREWIAGHEGLFAVEGDRRVVRV